jgi:penicillin-binding protein 2
LLILVAFAACSPNTPQTATPASLPPPGATRTLPQVSPTIISVPDAEVAARVFLMGWQAEDYSAMYNMLTPTSQDAVALDKFSRRYIDTANRMTLQKFEFEILSKLTKPTTAQVAYRVTFHTKMLGDLVRDMTMNLSLEKGDWRVQWDDGLILPELRGGNTLALDLKTPTRGNIYDRDGEAIAAANDVFALGIVKSEMDGSQESLLLSELSRLTGILPDTIKAMYDNDYTYLGDYVPVGEAPRDEVLERYEVLSSLTEIGLRMTDYSGRFYYNQGVAPHVTGYVQQIYAEELDSYLRQGYRQDDLVGKAGLEVWGEQYLLGQRGASLYVTDPQGSPITRLAQVDSKPSESIYTTIDKDLQLQVQRAMAGFSGAAVCWSVTPVACWPWCLPPVSIPTLSSQEISTAPSSSLITPQTVEIACITAPPAMVILWAQYLRS